MIDSAVLGVGDREIVLNMGPQHPSTHGVFRLVLRLDGETVVDVVPVMGYLHRSTEKLAESKTYLQCIPMTDRLDYLAPMSNNLAYVLAVEKLAGLEVPERAQYLRVIMCEFQRIASHLIAIGTFGLDVGTWFTPLIYAFREREKILDLFSMAAGVRMNPSYIRFNGVARDVPDGWVEMATQFVEEFPSKIDEYEALLTHNEIFQMRTKGIGVLPADLAVANSVTGPILRASGVKYDIRKVEPYSIYDRFEFDVPTGENGDCFDRYLVRVREMRESTKILRQALRDIPPGETKGRGPKQMKPPKGAAYARIEAPKGELGWYVVSNGGVEPYRFKIRAPSFINLNVLKELTIGHRVADAVVILGSFDIVMGEVDR